MRSTRFKLFVGGAVVAGMLLAACGSSSKGTGSSPTTKAESPAKLTKSPIVLGSPTPIASDIARTGVYSKPVMEAWEKWVNDNGGINGHPVKIVIRDSGGTPAQSQATVRQLVEQDKVLAFVAHTDLFESSWVEYSTAQKLPVIGGGAGLPGAANWFPIVYPGALYFKNILDTADTLGLKSVMQVACGEDPTCAQGEKLIQAALPSHPNIKYLGQVLASASEPSLTAQCLAIKGKKPEFVQLTISGLVMAKLINECTKQGFTATYGAAHTAFNTHLLDATGATIVSNTPGFPWWIDNPKVEEFRQMMKKYAPDADYASNIATTTYASLELFRKAMANISDNPTRDEVMKLMHEVKDENLGGLLANSVSYPPDQSTNQLSCGFLVGIKDGKFYSPQGEGKELTPACIK